jgi:hypothetical protein
MVIIPPRRAAPLIFCKTNVVEIRPTAEGHQIIPTTIWTFDLDQLK